MFVKGKTKTNAPNDIQRCILMRGTLIITSFKVFLNYFLHFDMFIYVILHLFNFVRGFAPPDSSSIS